MLLKTQRKINTYSLTALLFFFFLLCVLKMKLANAMALPGSLLITENENPQTSQWIPRNANNLRRVITYEVQDNFHPTHPKRVKAEANALHNLYGNNLRSFQQLGHYAMSLNRRRKQQLQKDNENTEPKTLNIVYAAPSSLFREHAPLTPMALASTSANGSVEDNKRALFLSTGWAPGGLNELTEGGGRDGEAQDNNDKPEMTQSNAYAFTSNHWGPMGKRNFLSATNLLETTDTIPPHGTHYVAEYIPVAFDLKGPLPFEIVTNVRDSKN